jgi:hypothetical protein
MSWRNGCRVGRCERQRKWGRRNKKEEAVNEETLNRKEDREEGREKVYDAKGLGNEKGSGEGESIGKEINERKHEGVWRDGDNDHGKRRKKKKKDVVRKEKAEKSKKENNSERKKKIEWCDKPAVANREKYVARKEDDDGTNSSSSSGCSRSSSSSNIISRSSSRFYVGKQEKRVGGRAKLRKIT